MCVVNTVRFQDGGGGVWRAVLVGCSCGTAGVGSAFWSWVWRHTTVMSFIPETMTKEDCHEFEASLWVHSEILSLKCTKPAQVVMACLQSQHLGGRGSQIS